MASFCLTSSTNSAGCHSSAGQISVVSGIANSSEIFLQRHDNQTV